MPLNIEGGGEWRGSLRKFSRMAGEHELDIHKSFMIPYSKSLFFLNFTETKSLIG